MHVQIAQATLADLDAVLAVMDEAGAWLHSIGVTEQWPASFSTSSGWVSLYRRWVGSGNLYGARIDGSIVGVFRLQDADEEIWPGTLPNEALYIHSLARRRSVAGAGVAQAMLDWALTEASNRGRRELRLDCWAGNERLKRYYLEAGFESRGDIELVSGGRSYAVSHFARAAG